MSLLEVRNSSCTPGPRGLLKQASIRRNRQAVLARPSRWHVQEPVDAVAALPAKIGKRHRAT